MSIKPLYIQRKLNTKLQKIQKKSRRKRLQRIFRILMIFLCLSYLCVTFVVGIEAFKALIQIEESQYNLLKQVLSRLNDQKIHKNPENSLWSELQKNFFPSSTKVISFDSDNNITVLSEPACKYSTKKNGFTCRIFP